ncbi:MAG: SDR family NAD(P)-dependent oxidoreductase, partial [Alphaproteobacteria bacterium]|nr:SDR family NAD(P)-dependent oxidoreductase [Alphaproteobacteria bacterium]
MRLSGKRVLITGAASGIGEATARRFAAEGAAVMLADLNLDAAQAVADDIATGGAAIARAVAVDVTDDAQVALMIKVAIDALGGVDVIVNNAGIPMVGPVETLSGEDWDLELDVNLKSIYRTSKAIWPHFRAQGGGVILNTASVAGLVGMAGQHSYSVAKAGVVMLTKCMA